jgi:predicted dehydrogenase
MLKVGLVGFGFMGRMHFDNYVGFPVRLAAVCDIRIEQLKDGKADGNMDTAKEVYDLSAFRLYDELENMIAAEELDVIDLAVPTYLHSELACSLLKRGYHVLCEKPMARTSAEARKMIEAAVRSSKKLMIGQCLRFWPGYEYLKELVESGRFGQVTEGYFYRGSGSPKSWFLDEKLSGGAILDMHIHDSDMIQYLFGSPVRVSTLGRNVLPGTGYDICSTHYVYPDGKVINAQVDWTLEGDFGFYMGYRVNFEQGNVVFDGAKVRVHPNHAPGYEAELAADDGYYRELVYFLEGIVHDRELSVCLPESAAESLELVEAEVESAASGGEWVRLR